MHCALSSDFEVMMVMNHEGRLVQDIRPLTAFFVRVILEKDGKRAVGRVSLGVAVIIPHYLKMLICMP